MLVEGLRVLRLLLVVPEDAKEVRGGEPWDLLVLGKAGHFKCKMGCCYESGTSPWASKDGSALSFQLAAASGLWTPRLRGCLVA